MLWTAIQVTLQVPAQAGIQVQSMLDQAVIICAFLLDLKSVTVVEVSNSMVAKPLDVGM